MHEWARQGQPQDGITHALAGSAYLGLLGLLPSLVWFVYAVVQADRKRRGYTSE